MSDPSHQFPKFYMTTEQPCPYLKGKQERKIFTDLIGEDASAMNEALGKVGFRRSQSVAYRPACSDCSACVSVRVKAFDYEPSRNKRRIIAKNSNIYSSYHKLMATNEQYDLLKRYLDSRHKDGGMSNMDEFEYAEMILKSPVESTIIEYRMFDDNTDDDHPGQLVGAALTDIMSDGLSMVYSFYDPDMDERSLGTFIILDHISRAQDAGLPYVYLGYWVDGCKKMAYKVQFKPMEILSKDGWMNSK